MDSDPIPTEPTTDPEPPVTAPVVPGPSLASESPAAGRGRGSNLRRAAIGLALVLTLSVGIGVGRLDLPALGGTGSTTPAPGSSAAPDFGLIREAWDILHTKYVGADTLNDKDLIYGAINGMTEAVGDTGHTSFMTPEQRADRSSDLSGKYVGIGVRIDTADDGLPLVIGVAQGQPGREGRLPERRRDRRRRRQADQGPHHRRDRRVGPRRGRFDRQGDRLARLDRHRARGQHGPRGCRGRARVLGARPGHEDGPHPPRAVLGGRCGCDQGGTDGHQGSRRRSARPRPARGSGRPSRPTRSRASSWSGPLIERAADGHETKPGRARRARHDPPLVVSSTAARLARRDRVRRHQDAGRAQIVGVKTYGTGTVLGESAVGWLSLARGHGRWLTPDGADSRGITPDVIVERASDIAPLDPDQVGKMTPAQIAALTDPQLARALTLVTAATATGG